MFDQQGQAATRVLLTRTVNSARMEKRMASGMLRTWIISSTALGWTSQVMVAVYVVCATQMVCPRSKHLRR